MKGVVFNLLEQAVKERFGEEAWDALAEDAGVAGAHTSLGDYDDADVDGLVASASLAMGVTADEVLEWFGRAAMPMLRDRYPALFEAHRGSRSFISSVNTIIHPEVRKLYAGAACPFFHFRDGPGGTLLMRYDSTRRLVALALGFAKGAADLWGETLQVERRDAPDGQYLSMAWA